MWQWKRWWGVRHVRYFFLKRDLYWQARTLAEYGLGSGVPYIDDLIFLELVWRGKR